MKRKTLLFLFLTVSISIFAQDKNNLNANLIELSDIYRNFMFRNNPTSRQYDKLEEIKHTELETIANFVEQTITTNNKLVETEFLSLPDTNTLKYVYAMRKLVKNYKLENPRDNNELLNEIMNKNIDYNNLVCKYYETLYMGIGNKNRPFDMSDVNFELDDYNFKNDTEEAIFFLKAMELFGTMIWGYMNVVKPPNYKLALQYINKYPKFNGQLYYQYLNFNFPDFEVELHETTDSFKKYYLNKYYDTLISHMQCLGQKKKYKEERLNLGLGSILKEEKYYKYSDKKELLDGLFQTFGE